MDILGAIVQSAILIAGGIITVLTALVVEQARRPKLQLMMAAHTDAQFNNRPATRARFVHLKLVNRPSSGWTRWVPRQIATQCHGTITFYYLNGQAVFDKDMPIRWASSREPIPSELRAPGTLQITGLIYDLSQLSLESWIDVPPGEGQTLNVAVRLDNDTDCYGWSNESYFSYPRWRNPDRKLTPGVYVVKVTVIAGGEKCTEVLRLMNEGPMVNFRLELAQKDDIKKIASSR